MSRPFEFRRATQAQARFRQTGLCACCGDKLDDIEEHAHHVIPNQSGDANDVAHAWISSADNCVVLCHTCHDRVHQDGRFRAGAVAPPGYFRYSHGQNTAAHRSWVTQLTRRSRSVWS